MTGENEVYTKENKCHRTKINISITWVNLQFNSINIKHKFYLIKAC